MGAWKYWKELPYRDKSKPDDNGKYKNRREIQRARRQNTIMGLTLFGVLIVVAGLLVFADDPGDYEGMRNFLLIFGGVFVLMIILARWTDSMNSYLRADDLDPRYLSEDEDEANSEIMAAIFSTTVSDFENNMKNDDATNAENELIEQLLVERNNGDKTLLFVTGKVILVTEALKDCDWGLLRLSAKRSINSIKQLISIPG